MMKEVFRYGSEELLHSKLSVISTFGDPLDKVWSKLRPQQAREGGHSIDVFVVAADQIDAAIRQGREPEFSHLRIFCQS